MRWVQFVRGRKRGRHVPKDVLESRRLIVDRCCILQLVDGGKSRAVCGSVVDCGWLTQSSAKQPFGRTLFNLISELLENQLSYSVYQVAYKTRIVPIMGRTLNFVIAATIAVGCLLSNSQVGFSQQAKGTNQKQANAKQRKPISQDMLRVLQFWEKSSSRIKKLRGNHHRIILNHTYKTEMQSRGVFYYEGPDKGRMDIEPITIKEGAKSKRIDKKTNKPYDLITDRPEKWICNGKKIWEIDVKEKVATEIDVPPSNQGQNIMEGPLPFLFGMPAEMAQDRYELSFVKPLNADRQFIWLEILPRWDMDAQNWSKARLRIDKQTFLPSAVQMVNPGGNLETTYIFEKLVKNSLDLPWRNPFQPSLRGYKLNVMGTGPQKQVVPSVVNLHGKAAQKVIEGAGYKVQWMRGDPPPSQKFKHVVYEQFPKASAELEKGQSVKLRIYTPPKKGASR